MVGKRRALALAIGFTLAGCASPGMPPGVDGGGGGDGPVMTAPDGGVDGSGGSDGGVLTCPMGFGDCDHLAQNGCETNLNTVDHCGACDRSCDQAGGTNACVLVGTSYVCQPTCDATHADCDGNPANGCEADLTSAKTCGACNVACQNPHGAADCTAAGSSYACTPTCDPGWAACGAATDGCATDVSGDASNCGGCGRACSSNHVATLACSGGACAPSCAAPFSDCSTPAAPAADDGCETNGTVDPGEPDNTCGGQGFTVEEGSTVTLTTNRILPAGDTDTFSIYLHEGSHTCFPGTSQSYNAKIVLTPPGGVGLALGYNQSSCDNTWQSIGNTLCYHWGGTCGGDDSTHYYVQVSGPGGVNACGYYTLSVQYASEGNSPPGCP